MPMVVMVVVVSMMLVRALRERRIRHQQPHAGQ
jgi:hypothetical protein